MPRRAWWGLVALLVIVALVTTYAVTRPPGPPVLTQRDVDTSVQRGIEKQAEADAAAPADGSVAHAAIAPSLVLIQTRDTVGGAQRRAAAPGSSSTPTARC